MISENYKLFSCLTNVQYRDKSNHKELNIYTSTCTFKLTFTFPFLYVLINIVNYSQNLFSFFEDTCLEHDLHCVFFFSHLISSVERL